MNMAFGDGLPPAPRSARAQASCAPTNDAGAGLVRGW